MRGLRAFCHSANRPPINSWKKLGAALRNRAAAGGAAQTRMPIIDPVQSLQTSREERHAISTPCPCSVLPTTDVSPMHSSAKMSSSTHHQPAVNSRGKMLREPDRERSGWSGLHQSNRLLSAKIQRKRG